MAGWVHIVPNPNTPPHACSVPNYGEVRRCDAWTGSRWQCFHCCKVWTLTDGGCAWQPAEPTE